MALRGLEDDDGAFLELRAAADEFRRLGAMVDAAAAERLLAEAEDRRRAPEQVRKAFMFTDIVGSHDARGGARGRGLGAAAALARRHAPPAHRRGRRRGRELDRRRVLRRVRHAARKAVDCAVAIQRALREHQESIGFAPPIRIGLHSAEANRRGQDYSGIGVHVAARVGALAGSGEILATQDTLTEAGEPSTAAPREVTVKGVSTPLQVVPVAWS